MKEIPVKNYVILGVLVVITVLAVFYLRNIYIATIKYDSANSVIETVANQINEDEISNYTLENPRTILYVSSGQDMEIKDFEKELKNIIEKNDLSSSTLYINKDNVADMNNFIDKLKSLCLNESAKAAIDANSEASLYIFENDKIKYVVSNVSELDDSEIKLLLKRYGMVENE